MIDTGSPRVTPTATPVQDSVHRSHRVEVPLLHHIDVSRATEYLLHHLGCSAWHVACHHDHQWIVQLTEKDHAKYTICYECSPAVEKGIYHGSRAWAMTITPLHAEADLSETKVAEIRAGLADLR